MAKQDDYARNVTSVQALKRTGSRAQQEPA